MKTRDLGIALLPILLSVAVASALEGGKKIWGEGNSVDDNSDFYNLKPNPDDKPVENNYDASYNNYNPGGNSNGNNYNNGKCGPSYFPPDPNSGCCGIQASDENRLLGRHRRDTRENVTLGVRITGGTETKLTDFPWTVRLESVFKYPGTFIAVAGCGGALISSRFVLTAEHCLTDPKGPLLSTKVYLAEYNKKTFPQDCKYEPGVGRKCIQNIVIYGDKAVIHTNFNRQHLYNDIGLVKLHKDAPYTDYIRPICLPPGDIDNPSFRGTHLKVSGWGMNGKHESNIKQWTVLNLVLQDQCKRYYSDLSREDICAAGYNGEDTCEGDSGGPLMAYIGNKYYVVGLVSGKRSDFDCGTAIPTLFTSVYHYMDWIRDNMEHS